MQVEAEGAWALYALTRRGKGGSTRVLREGAGRGMKERDREEGSALCTWLCSVSVQQSFHAMIPLPL